MWSYRAAIGHIHERIRRWRGRARSGAVCRNVVAAPVNRDLAWCGRNNATVTPSGTARGARDCPPLHSRRGVRRERRSHHDVRGRRRRHRRGIVRPNHACHRRRQPVRRWSVVASGTTEHPSNESALAAQDRPEEEASPARHGLATLLAFVIAGAVPLAPFALGFASHELKWSIALTFATLFSVGALRALVTVDRWWVAGLEMLLLGLAVAAAAYGSGSIVARFTMTG